MLIIVAKFINSTIVDFQSMADNRFIIAPTLKFAQFQWEGSGFLTVCTFINTYKHILTVFHFG